MAIALRCPCGHRLNVKDSAAGKSVECPECFMPLDVPRPNGLPVRDEATAEPDFAAAAELSQACDMVDDDVDQEQRDVIGDLADKPVRCPYCGQATARAVTRCRSCKKSFREGPCARCGITRSSWQQCECEARPVIWGTGQFPALCTQCGHDIRTRASGESSCPWCASTEFLTKHLRGGAPIPKDDAQRLAKLDRIAQSLNRKTEMIRESAPGGRGVLAAIYNFVVGGFVLTIKTAFMGALFGELGQATAMAGNRSPQDAHFAETGLYSMEADASSAAELAERFRREANARKSGQRGWKTADGETSGKGILRAMGVVALVVALSVGGFMILVFSLIHLLKR